MATKFVTVNGAGTGDGSTWGNAGSWANISTVLAACSNGDTIKIEAGPGYVATGTTNWNKRVNLKGETQGGADARAIITGGRTNPWPVNGVWTDGKTVGGVTYPTLVAGNAGQNVFTLKDQSVATGGCTFSWLAFRDCGTPFKPVLTSAAKTGVITVNDCVTYNTNGLVYIDSSNDGQVGIVANRCRGVAYSEGMFRAFAQIILTDCHGDGKNQFHSPTTNLFGSHVQDNSRNIQVTFTASTDQATFSSAHALLANDPVIFIGTSGAAPITDGTVYFIKTVVSSTVATLSTTAGGALLDITADGTAGGLQLSTSMFDFQATRCSFINHSAAAPAGSSKDPAVTGNYPQGDGFVAEENTNWLPSIDLYASGNIDRGIDLKCAIPLGNLQRYYGINNGYAIAAHDDTVETYVSNSFLGSSFRPSYDTDKAAPLQASGHLNAVRCVIEQRNTGAATQYIAAYGSVQAAHLQSGVNIPDRVGRIQVFDSVINLKSGHTESVMSAGGGPPPVTPQYFKTNVTVVSV